MESQETEQIIKDLIKKATIKQEIYGITLDIFNSFKAELKTVDRWIGVKTLSQNKNFKVKYSESGDFEAELKFASDTLVFMMHTNVFNFPDENMIFKTSYVKQDPSRSFCGTIMIYNFLSDSLKYNRMEDLGYLMARIFVNKEKHFFIQGQRQYSFLFRDFANLVMDKKNIRKIILTSIQQAIEFDLLVPPFETVNQLTVGMKMQSEGNFALRTGKRLGFSIKTDEEDED